MSEVGRGTRAAGVPGSAGSVTELYRVHYRELLEFFRHRFSDREGCEDLCQEVFLRLLLADAADVPPLKPSQWLTRVAHNLLVDTYRRRAVAQANEHPAEPAEKLMGDEASWQRLEQQELVVRIAATFRRLATKPRQLLYWREVEGVSVSAIAGYLGNSAGVVATELSRARRQFRREYLRLHCQGLLQPDEEIFHNRRVLDTFDPLTDADDQLHSIDTRVRSYFDRIAPAWDSYVASAYEAELEQRLRHMLPWHPGMHVLDVGTGTGYMALMVAPMVGEVVGIDCSAPMLQRAGEKATTRRIANATWRQSAAERLPLATGAVDVVLCHMLLHHVVSPRRVLRELRRVVRPGGYLVVIDADRHNHFWTPDEFGDVHYGTDRRRIRRHARAAGFEPLVLEGAGVSDSGPSVGRDASFANFLLLARAAGR